MMNRMTRGERLMKREDYKAIKHMNKHELEEYLLDVYFKGYEKAVEVMQGEMSKQNKEGSVPESGVSSA